ncbi:hypothetical protein I5M27_17165 [Adhaeribacter sp. BT258]|uniref:YCII-related domain-containing protein n=1 Tax=Adhaeribacter terrigena TaxID=2793070 RepID=A0ABS1C5R4_9BACT|nr:hypothetical protein [Adhaeribacter terrigena]MBK0404727.1 hypothetical protein [Adhaeribacter terrigena]
MENPNFQFVPQDILPQMANMKPYTILLLKKGPEFSSSEAQKIIQAEHLPHLFKLRAEGKMLLSMPVMDNTDVAAVGIYNSLDKAALAKLTETDPAVQKGVFTYELLNSVGMKGDTLV